MSIIIVASGITHGNSVVIPKHRRGDRVLIYAFNRAAATPPTVDNFQFAGQSSSSAANGSGSFVRALLSAGDAPAGFTAGPYANATAVAYLIMRSSDPERYAVGIESASTNSSASSTSITFNAVTGDDPARLYRFLLLGAHANNNGTITAAVAGASLVVASNGSGGGIAIHLSDPPTTNSFGAVTAAIGATAGASRGTRLQLFEFLLYPGGWALGDFVNGTSSSEISDRNRVIDGDQAEYKTLDLRRARGQYYAEIHCSVQSVAASTIVAYRVIGNHNPSSHILYRADGASLLDSVATGVTLETLSAGDTVCMAIDTVLKKVWFRKNAGNWNNSVTDNPVTGAGGFSMNGQFQHLVLEAAARGSVTVRHHLRERFADFVYSVPSGYNEFYEPPHLDQQFFRMF